MPGTLVRRVLLQIEADDATAAEKLDRIKERADELKEASPELAVRIDTAAASAKLRVLRDELKAAGDEIKDVAAEAEAEPLEIRVSSTEAKARLDAIKRNAEELRELNPTLIPRIDDAEASAKLAVLRGELKETEAEGEGLGKAWDVAKYALLGVAGGLGYGIYKAAGFNQEMTRLHTQAGVATGKLGGLGSKVLQLAGQVGQDPDSLAEALYHVESNLSSMGATSTQVMSAVKVSAQGASVGGANLVDVTNALGSAIASGIPGVENYQQAMGAMNATVGAGDMTMQNLSDAFGHGTLANMKLYGATLTDVGAIAATFGDNNIRGAAAGTQMKMSVQALAVQASTAGPALQELGLKAGELGEHMRLHGAVSTVNLLVSRMKAAGVTSAQEGTIITELFGKKAGAGIGVLVDQVDRLNSKVPVITKGAHDFGQAWADQAQTPQQKLKDLEAGSEALATSLGTDLLPAATTVLGWLTSFVNDMEKGNGWALTLAGTVGGILGLVALKKLQDGLSGAVEGAESLWKGGAKLLSWAGKMTSALRGQAAAQDEATAAQEEGTVATEEATVAQEELDVAEEANPIGAIILLLLALGAGIYELVTHWKTLRHVTAEVFDAVRHDVAEAGHDASAWFDRIRHDAAELGHGLAHTFDDVRHDIAQWADDAGHDAERVATWFERLPGRIAGFLSQLPGMMLKAGTQVISSLIQGAESMIGWAGSKLEGFGHDLLNDAMHPFGIHFSEPSEAVQVIKAGRNIPLGLAKGMDAEAGAVTASMHHVVAAAGGGQDLARQIGEAAAAAARGAAAAARAAGGYGQPAAGGAHYGAPQRLELEWTGGGGDQALITLLKNHIRVAGGDPSVLGR